MEWDSRWTSSRPTGVCPLLSIFAATSSKKLDIKCEDDGCYDLGFKRRQRRKVIITSPEILVVRLVRFAQRYNKCTGRMDDYKVRTSVSYEEYLNLGEFTEDGEPCLYRLDGVVAHGGDNVDAGHYISAIREREGKYFSVINDDISIERRLNGTVEAMRRPGAGFDPYLLFYSKV